MNNLRAISLLSILVFYPLLAFLSRSYVNMSMDYAFSFLGFGLLGAFLIEKIVTGENIRIPHYLSALGVFAFYKLLTAIFVSNLFIETGTAKYLYSDPFIASFVLLLLIENTQFSKGLIKKAIVALPIMLLLAMGVIVYQISDPLFFYDQSLVGANGLDYDRFQEYMNANPDKVDDNMGRMRDGYRFSIYSWINEISIGIDSIAIFSLLFGLKLFGNKKKSVIWFIGGVISFLSNSRWIMLNFLIVSSQKVLSNGNKLINAFKYLGITVFFVSLIFYGAMALGVDVQDFIANRLLDKGANTRIYAFEVFFKVFPNNPIWGTGGVDTPEMLRLIAQKTSQIHVGYLKLFYYYGIVGAIFYLIFLATLLSQLRQRAIATQYWGSFYAFLAFALANCTLVELDIFYHGLLLAVVFSTSTWEEKELTETVKERTSELNQKLLARDLQH